MAKQTEQLAWVEMDVDAMGDKTKAAYEAYKVAQREAAKLRVEFEEMVNAVVRANMPGRKMVFGYRFGKLSAAIVDDDRKPAKVQAKAQSLVDYLAQMNGSGRRC